MLHRDWLARRMEKGVIEIAPLGFMRGRTLTNAFVILDEAQNATTIQMKMFLTRLGEGARMAVTGDLSQIDLPPGSRSGLAEALQITSDLKDVTQVHFSDRDVIRPPLVSEIVRAYERAAVRSKVVTRTSRRMTQVVLQIADPRWTRPGLTALAHACAARAIRGHGSERANLRLTSDAEMRMLNRCWRHVDRSTNVLSFPQEDTVSPDAANPELGDVAIGFETTEREARERDLPLSHHLAHLAVHGMLHLVGFRHDTDPSAQCMEDLERAMLADFGIGDPYRYRGARSQ